ncbi:MAG: methylated-DNA--[protein]-cysteine S-methyltransferase [Myxococcaceae bacterium]
MNHEPWRPEVASHVLRIEVADLLTPLGRVELAVREEGLCALDFTEHPVHERLLRCYPGATLVTSGKLTQPFVDRLRAYFEGEVRALEGLPVLAAGTAFQQGVWSALRTIGVGTTQSYADIARRIGRPSATRAVGAANGRNPVALVVPCHRVIASDGGLGGYAGGLARKAWLLAHERG